MWLSLCVWCNLQMPTLFPVLLCKSCLFVTHGCFFCNPNFSLGHWKIDGKHTCSLKAGNSDHNVNAKYLWPVDFFCLFCFSPASSFLFRYHCFALLCFSFSSQGIVQRISFCDITHNKHIPQGCVNIKASVWGYNPFEMHLSVITHRRGWSPAWLWGSTLPRCLAHTLTPPGLQQGAARWDTGFTSFMCPNKLSIKNHVNGFISFLSQSRSFPLRPPIGHWF